MPRRVPIGDIKVLWSSAREKLHLTTHDSKAPTTAYNHQIDSHEQCSTRPETLGPTSITSYTPSLQTAPANNAIKMPPKSKRTPTPAATIPPSPSKTDLPSSASIHEIHNTLHVLYHRNKNQHSCAKWFKQLSVLRRETRKLAWELETVERLEEDFDDGVDLAREDVRRRMEFLGREVVLRCYRCVTCAIC